ncbi:MAG: amidohydrolase [Bacteroidia bacterium]|nr:MAG: amidohydrolase [Bacteroidia bacterium]
MKRKALLFIFFTVLMVCLLSSCGVDQADTIYINANIYTADEDLMHATALAVKGDRFVYVGNTESAMAFAGRKTRVADLEGLTVIPGLTESHMHFDGLAKNLLMAPLDIYWLPMDALLETIGEAVARADSGAWIVARGYNDAIWEDPPHRHLLDAVSPYNPVVLRRYCGHAHFVNSLALRVAGITAETVDPEAGIIVRDESGEPTGVLVSAAGALVTRHIPPDPDLDHAQWLEAYRLAGNALLAAGITTAHDLTPTTLEDVAIRKDAFEKGLLKVRLMDAVTESAAKEMRTPLIGLYDHRYTVRWVKKFVDGSLGGRGAALLEPYDDMSGETGALRPLGEDTDVYARLVADLLELGFSTRTHSIGDRGNRATLDAFEKAMEISGKSPREARLVVEHAQILHPEDIRRFADRKILASMQPIHATEDMLFVESRIGYDRAYAGAYAWRSILDAGGLISAGSDYYVSPFNPFYGLHAAVTRQDRENNPPDGWFSEQSMTREEALKAYTIWPAYLEFSEDIKGSISPGKLADFLVIDRDYMAIPAEDIHRIRVLKTVLGGEVVFDLADD